MAAPAVHQALQAYDDRYLQPLLATYAAARVEPRVPKPSSDELVARVLPVGRSAYHEPPRPRPVGAVLRRSRDARGDGSAVPRRRPRPARVARGLARPAVAADRRGRGARARRAVRRGADAAQLGHGRRRGRGAAQVSVRLCGRGSGGEYDDVEYKRGRKER
ncbi:hypothetical protein PG987_012439 [Apiospora arundinis]